MSILDVNELSVQYSTSRSSVSAVNSVDLGLRKGETMGLVGESGPGKSTLGLSLLQLLPPPSLAKKSPCVLNGVHGSGA